MSFFDTVRDEVKKEYGSPKVDLGGKEKEKEEITGIQNTSLDFLKDQAKRYSEQAKEEETEKKPLFEPPEPQRQEEPESFKPELKQELRPEENIANLLKDIRDQNREILNVLREIKNKETGKLF